MVPANARFLFIFLVAGCTSGDTAEPIACGPNGECPSGFTCDPKSNTCRVTGATGVDAGGGTPDAAAALPDARAGAIDARAASADARTPDASAPDAPGPDAPPPAALTVAPGDWSFDLVTVGDTATKTFTVTNGGGQTSGPIASSADEASFSVTGGTCAGMGLAAGAQCTVIVTFAPTVAGDHTATLTVDASPGGPATATLGGTGATAGALMVTPTKHDYGPIAVAAGGGMDFTVKNTGQSPTGSVAVMLADTTDFRVSANGCSGALDAGATCTVSVAFEPTSAGAHSTMLQVMATPGGSPSAMLSGTGTAQVKVTNGGGGTVSSDPAGIDCGATCTATFSDAPVVLQATPEATHVFAGWGGVCSGTGDCSLPLDKASSSVTASFMCPAGEDECLGVCVDLQTDSSNCGKCGKVCAVGSCSGGLCPINFTQEKTPTTDSLSGIWGFSATDIWVVGGNYPSGTILHLDASGQWQKVPSNIASTCGLEAVWGSGPSDVWAVGCGGTIAHYDGTWSQMTNPATSQGSLFAVWGSGPNDVWAVGAFGTMLHWDGSWHVVTEGPSDYRQAMWGNGQNNLWCSGQHGSILHYTGSWNAVDSGVPAPNNIYLNGIWGISSSNIWAVGDAGTITHYDGQSWTNVWPPYKLTGSGFYAVWGSGANDVYAAGYGGVIWHKASGDWEQQTSPAIDTLTGIWGTDADHVWMVGGGGVILKGP